MSMSRVTLTVVAIAAVAAACASLSSPPARLSGATGATLKDCAGLAQAFSFGSTRIESSVPAAADALPLAGKPAPAHCLVRGRMHERTGSDGRNYAIGFEMRLPLAWNGRFYHQVNGGVDGVVQPALGALGGGPVTGALHQGFAVISSDAGHSAAQIPVFGMEPQARVDYGYQAVIKLTPMAKSLIREAYGKGPDRSYIAGCSNGGRHVMVAAARVPDEYDGYLVGAPGYRIPLAALAQMWGVQQWTPLATPGATIPHPQNPAARIADLATAFTPQERQAVADAILQRCDALDGARDGMIFATQACQAAFDPQRDLPGCSGGRTGSCLGADQKRVVMQVHAGATTPAGQRFYSPFPWDAGIAGSNWAQWKYIESLTRTSVSLGTIFSTPPAPIDLLTTDVGAALGRVHATNDQFRESGMSAVTPPGHENPVNMAVPRARGARMVIYHGVADAVFSAEDTRQWVERVDRAQGGRGEDFVRYFPVPGMNHCSGGPGADQFDLLGPLVRWVEEGVAPQAIVATARGAGNPGGVNAELPAGWSANRQRPLCAYPKVATYIGGGPLESAASFACR